MRKQIEEKYHRLTSELIRKKLSISVMESCTGGLIASLISDASGASEIFEHGLVTYSNLAKIESGVDPDVIEQYGVYSIQTAMTMAAVCIDRFGTDIGIGVTGSIGRIDPANPDSVLGEVYIAIDAGEAVHTELVEVSSPERMDARYEIADHVCELLIEVLADEYSE